MKFIIMFTDIAPEIEEGSNVYEMLKQLLKNQDALNQKMVSILIDSGKMDIPELIRIINNNCCIGEISAIYSVNEEVYHGENI